MMDTVGKRIKNRRKELKLTLEGLAKLIDSSKSYVWELENKGVARPSAEKLLKLAEALQTSMSYLLGQEENFPKEELRDKFAMVALQALITKHGEWLPHEDALTRMAIVSRSAYLYADAMLKERNNEV